MTSDNTRDTSDNSTLKRHTTTVRFRPYQYENDTINAAEQYVSLKSSPTDKRKILERLLITDDYFKAICPILLAAFPRIEAPIRHLILDNIIRLIIKGIDFSDYAGEIAKLMIDKNFKLREKATLLLSHMGENANTATPRIVAYLRNKLPDIQLSAIKVLSAIGPAASDQALPKLKTFSNNSPTPTHHEASLKAIQILKGELKPIRPDIKIEGVINSKPQNSNTGATSEENTPNEHAMLYPLIKGKSIVIAEDHESVRTMIRRALNSCGANTKETYDGDLVIKLIQAKIDIDLFILDLMMPEVNGAEVLKIIRNTPQYRLTPVIIISARTERSVKLKMAQLEVSAYFPKPFRLTELLGSINAIFEQ